MALFVKVGLVSTLDGRGTPPDSESTVLWGGFVHQQTALGICRATTQESKHHIVTVMVDW
jgi:hypothetical protein